ncbi:UNVERIFIED_CONTAM: hypothetical protein GTU68_045852 [Idotea baltica]
MITIS